MLSKRSIERTNRRVNTRLHSVTLDPSGNIKLKKQLID